jgi:hypothetical protein
MTSREFMARRTVDVAVIIPDASPVLTLARIGRLDLFETFSTPIHIVDQVHGGMTVTLAEMLDKLERGRIGHAEAMRWLGVASYNELVEIVHYMAARCQGTGRCR